MPKYHRLVIPSEARNLLLRSRSEEGSCRISVHRGSRYSHDAEADAEMSLGVCLLAEV